MNILSKNYSIPDIPGDLVERAKTELTRVWEGEQVDRPAFIVGWQAENYRIKLPVTERLNNPERDLRHNLATVDNEIEALHEGFCNVPSMLPYFGPCVLASAFGCEVEYTEAEGGLPWAHPLIHQPQEVYSIKKPDIRNSGLCKTVLERMAFFRDATDGKIPIRCTDTQSPADVASQVWHYEDFLAAMYTDPEEVHHLMRLVTDASIEFLYAQKETAHNLFAYGILDVWHHRGVHLCDDIAAIISPELFNEFVSPYNEELAREFDGQIIHCCRGYGQHLKKIAGSDGFLGADPNLDYHETQFVIECLRNKGVWVNFHDQYLQRIQPMIGEIGLILIPMQEQKKDAIEFAHKVKKELLG